MGVVAVAMKWPAIQTEDRQCSSEDVARLVAAATKFFPAKSATVTVPVARSFEDVIFLYAALAMGHTVVPIPREATPAEREKFRSVGEALVRPEPISPASSGMVADFPGPSCVLFTSGTTGEPKPVTLSGKQWRSSCAAFGAYHQVVAGDAWLLSLPLYHVGGFSILMRSVLLGLNLAIPSAVKAGDLRRWMESGSVQGASVVPTMLKRMLDMGTMHPRGMKKILVGGAAPSPLLMERARRESLPVEIAWGATETCAQVVGERVFPGVRVRIADDGEILVSGEMVVGGEWRSGDLGSFDSDGKLLVAGRKKDLINTGGVKVMPQEVESVLLEIPGVDEAAVWGVPDDEWGERVVAAVAPALIGESQIRVHLAARLSPQKHPKSIFLLPEFPAGHSGKTDRAALVRICSRP